MSTFKLLNLVFSFTLVFTNSLLAAETCSREWANQGIQNKSFRIIGLGLSSSTNPKTSLEEARAGAYQDISLQLQSSVQSHSQIQETESSSHFKNASSLTSHLDNLKGFKALKNGSNPKENITHCEVYEFNVQAAYEELSSKLNLSYEKFSTIQEYSKQKKWLELLRESNAFRSQASQIIETSQRADVFKISLGAPGPSWTERAEKSNIELDTMEKGAREHIHFAFPENQFEAAVAEVQGRVINAGIKTITPDQDPGPDALGIEVLIKALGKPTRSKTKLGLTITRNISIALKDMKTKKVLATGGSLSIVGSSPNQDEEEALANGDRQLIGALTDAVRNLAPGILKED